MNSALDPARQQLEELWAGCLAAAPNIIAAALIFGLFAIVGWGARRVVRRLSDRARRRRNLGLVLGRLAQATTLFLGFLVACLILFPTFKPGDLIQILGISTVAIGFAFRDILQNFLAGILLLFGEPFRINDQIVFGEYEGTVEDIETRATTIRTYDGRRIVIPNAQLFTNPVVVNTAFDVRRLEFDVGIAYGESLERARHLTLSALRAIDGVLAEPPPDVLVHDLADSSVTLRVRWWIQPPRHSAALDLRDRAISGVLAALQEEGVELPFPTREVIIHQRDGSKPQAQ